MFEWIEERHNLNLEQLDAPHRELVTRLHQTRCAGDAELLVAFTDFCAHISGHFAQEAEMMAACDCPEAALHQAEHQRIEAELKFLRRRLELGKDTMVRPYLEGMAEWFKNHLVTMDAALAAHYRLFLRDSGQL